MRAFVLEAEEYNLVRMGRKRAFVRLFAAPVPALKQIHIVNAALGHMILEGEITSYTLTRARYLTEEIAVKAGFMYLHDLMKALLDRPHLDESAEVTVIEFRCEGDE